MTKTLKRRVGALECLTAPITKVQRIIVRFIAAKDGAPDLSITPTEQVFTVDQTRRGDNSR